MSTYHIGKKLYGASIVLVLGLLFNVMTAIGIAINRKLMQRATSLYLIALALVDGLFCLFLLVTVIKAEEEVNKEYKYNWMKCKIEVFFHEVLLLLRSWVLVIMCFERLMNLLSMDQVSFFLKRKRAICDLILVFLWLVSICGITTYLTEECDHERKEGNLFSGFFLLDFFIPCWIMCGCALTIGNRVYCHTRHHSLTKEHHSQGLQQNTRQSQDDHHQCLPEENASVRIDEPSQTLFHSRDTSVIVLTLVICHLAFSTPYKTISFIISLNPRQLSHHLVVANLYAHLLNYMPFVLSIFIYTVIYPRFWQEIVSRICCRRQQGWENAISLI